MNIEQRRYVAKTADPGQLHLILYPTEQCNFRCVYCYEDFSHGAMPLPVIDGIKRLIENRIKKIKSLHISWFGGEPLAAKKVVFDICEYSKKICGENNVIFGGSLTTNGYLLDQATAERLSNLNQTSFQISLDGLGEIHDRSRPLMSGGGTFKKIWNNLKEIKDSNLDINILIRVHLMPSNLDSAEELIHSLNKTFLQDSRFSVALKPVGDWGGPNAGKIERLKGHSEKDAMERMGKLLNKKTSINTDPSVYVCYASKPNSLAIRSDGRIQKCTVALNSDANTIGSIREDGTVELDGGKLKLWMKGYEEGNLSLLSCPAAHIGKIQKDKTNAKEMIEIVNI